MKTDGKIAVVTGANRGLGKGLSAALARRGFVVLMVCRNREAGQVAVADLQPLGDVRLYVADMGIVSDIERLGEQIAADFDHVDVLVNNAAVNLDTAETRVANMPLETIERTMAINFRGPLWLCRVLLPLLRRSESGRIVNYSSGIGRLTISRSSNYPAYSMSKVAINGLTKQLAAELAGDGIVVNSVDPGWVKTDMGGAGAQLELEEGIQAALYQATAPAEELQTGCLYHQREVISW